MDDKKKLTNLLELIWKVFVVVTVAIFHGLCAQRKEIRGRHCGTEFLDADVTQHILFFKKQNDFCNLFIAR